MAVDKHLPAMLAQLPEDARVDITALLKGE